MGGPGRFRSLVALRGKKGEFQALDALNVDQDIRGVQPLIELDPHITAPKPYLDRVEQLVRHLYRLGHVVMLDASVAARRGNLSEDPNGPLGELVDRLELAVDLFDTNAPVPFVPVVRTDDTSRVASFLGELAREELRRGAALRVMPGYRTHRTLEPIIERLGLAPAELDVVVDQQYVRAPSQHAVKSVSADLEDVAQLGPFRSITLLAGSVPDKLEGTSTRRNPRSEEVLWRSVREVSRQNVRFGDYGVVHPIPPPRTYRSHHVNVKYSCRAGWLYLREPLTDQVEHPDENAAEKVRARTLRTLCRRLVDREEFAGPEFSWGDQQMAHAARGGDRVSGSTSVPVALATSHHIAYLANTDGT